MTRWLIVILLFTSIKSYSQLSEISSELGIKHLHESKELMGGGVTFIDINNDNLEDIYLTGGEKLGDKLYLNLGHDRFLDVSEEYKIDLRTGRFNTFGAITLDINNDGCDDLFVTTFDKQQRNILLLNSCEGSFVDISVAAGVIQTSSSTSASALDVNKDGYLDIYVVNYIDSLAVTRDENDQVIEFNHICLPNFLYMNNGDNTFSEVAVDYGVADIGCGLAVSSTDYNLDGYTDLYVVNDFGQWVSPNKLYENDNGTTFNDVSESTNSDVGIYGMGIASSDIERDGDLDYYVTNIGRNSFLLNNGSNQFTDVSNEFGLDNTLSKAGTNTTGWGTFFVDIDNNGFDDLYVSNGYIPAAPFLNNSLQDENRIYLNTNGTFTEATDDLDIGRDNVNRGTAYADLNKDGKIDFVTATCIKTDVGASSSSAMVYYNELNVGNWLQMQLTGTVSNRNAFGSLIYLYASGVTYIQELQSGGSHASQHSRVKHFGLGEVELVDSLVIQWPSGNSTTLFDINVNQRIKIEEGTSQYEVVNCENDENIRCYNHDTIGCTDSEALNYDVFAYRASNSQCVYEGTVTSVNEPGEGILIAPNPVKDMVTISLEKSKIQLVRIINMNGKIIYNDIPAPNVSTYTADISGIPVGVYFVMIVNEEGNTINKLILKD